MILNKESVASALYR